MRNAIVIVILLILVGAAFTMNSIISSEKSYPFTFMVIGKNDTKNLRIGISVDPDMLNFGVLPLGSSASKFILIENPDDRPVKVHVYQGVGSTGKIIHDRDNFMLYPGEQEKVTITAKGSETGNFSGNIVVGVKGIKNGWLEWILPLV